MIKEKEDLATKDLKTKHAIEHFFEDYGIFMNSQGNVIIAFIRDGKKIELNLHGFRKDFFVGLTNSTLGELLNTSPTTQNMDNKAIAENRKNPSDTRTTFILEYMNCIDREIKELKSDYSEVLSKYLEEQEPSIYIFKHDGKIGFTIIAKKDAPKFTRRMLKAKMTRKNLSELNSRIMEKYEKNTIMDVSIDNLFLRMTNHLKENENFADLNQA